MPTNQTTRPRSTPERRGIDFLSISLLRRSEIRLATGHHADAAADTTRALSLFQASGRPGDFSAYIGRAYLTLGHALQAQGKSEEARAAFRSAAENLQNTL